MFVVEEGPVASPGFTVLVLPGNPGGDEPRPHNPYHVGMTRNVVREEFIPSTRFGVSVCFADGGEIRPYETREHPIPGGMNPAPWTQRT